MPYSLVIRGHLIRCDTTTELLDITDQVPPGQSCGLTSLDTEAELQRREHERQQRWNRALLRQPDDSPVPFTSSPRITKEVVSPGILIPKGTVDSGPPVDLQTRRPDNPVTLTPTTTDGDVGPKETPAQWLRP